MLIRYYGGSGSFAEVSYRDVLNGTLQQGEFDDKIVLVGVNATAVTVHATATRRRDIAPSRTVTLWNTAAPNQTATKRTTTKAVS